MKQKAAITFESEETIVLKHRRKKVSVYFCPGCEAMVEMISPDVLALLTGISEREVFRLIENGQVHFVETERVFVCRDSLMNRSQMSVVAGELLNE